MMTAGMMKKMGWQVYEEVNQDKTGEADGMDQEVGSKTRWRTSKSAICDFILKEINGGQELVTTDKEQVPRGGWRQMRLWR